MIVYVETNFLLELTYRQERVGSCEEILELARNGRITLAIPAFSAPEAHMTFLRRSSERREFQSKLKSHIREIARSESFRGLVDQSEGVVAAFTEGVDRWVENLESAILTLETRGMFIPLIGEIAASARWAGAAFSLSPEDAIVLESIASHARSRSGPKCFITQDTQFKDPAIEDYLSQFDCKVLINFEPAAAYLRNALPPL